jgi:hypothetical protein
MKEGLLEIKARDCIYIYYCIYPSHIIKNLMFFALNQQGVISRKRGEG